MRSYFEPTKLERWRGGYVFERLGVRFFKRYLLLTELLLHRLRRRKKVIQRVQGTLDADLTALEFETKRNEAIHLAAIGLTGGLLLHKSWDSSLQQLYIGQIIAIFCINLYVNVYPILLQRYNRLRVTKVRELIARRGLTPRSS